MKDSYRQCKHYTYKWQANTMPIKAQNYMAKVDSFSGLKTL